MNGIDVSQWQGNIDFEAVKRAGIELVYIKASEGTDFVDPFFYRNYANAGNAGLLVGFYHYMTAQNSLSARQEASHFVSVTEGLSCAGRMVMDMEDLAGLTREEIRTIALSFLQSIEEMSNKGAAIYVDAATASQLDETLTEYPLWIAQYRAEKPDMDNPWRDWAGWQYTDQGRVAGIQGNVDRNIFKEAILDEDMGRVQKSGVCQNHQVVERSDGRDIGRMGDMYRLYRVRTGDTLHGIAARYGTDVYALIQMNRIPNPNLIYAGQQIKIPSIL